MTPSEKQDKLLRTAIDNPNSVKFIAGDFQYPRKMDQRLDCKNNPLKPSDKSSEHLDKLLEHLDKLLEHLGKPFKH